MKLLKAGVILAVVCLSFQAAAKDFYQLRQRPIEEARKSANFHRFITDKNKYNSYFHGGLFTGKLDMDIAPFSGSLSGRIFKRELDEKDDTLLLKSKQFYLPAFNLGTPGSRIFSGYYHLAPKSSYNGDTLKIIDHRFGLAFGAQTEDKTFRFGFDFSGAAGKEQNSDNDDKRVYYSLDNLEIGMGSKPSERVTLSLAVGSDAVFDSLNNDKVSSDKFFEITIPRITFESDFGDSLLPYRSSLAFTYGRKHFVYTIGPFDNKSDQNALISDSVNWHWMNMWDIDVVDNFQIHPAFDIGYMHNRHKQMNPGSDNNPFQYDGEAEGLTWEEKSFLWGLGTSFKIVRFIDLFAEYGRNTLTLDLTGENISQDVKDSLKDNDGYNRFMTGFTMGFHDINGVDFSGNQLYFDFSFLTVNENGIYDTLYANNLFSNLLATESGTQGYRYAPWESYEKQAKTNRIGLGLRGIFKEGQVETAANIGFITQTHTDLSDDDFEQTHKGIELNFDIIYNVESFAKE